MSTRQFITKGNTLMNIPFTLLVFGENIREEYNAIQELADSIQQNGIRVPLKVKKVGDKYEVIAGHRRYLAIEKLVAKKIEVTIPCDIMEKDATKDDEVLEMFIENDGENLTPLEQANGILLLLTKSEYAWTPQLIADRLGKSKNYINELKRLGELPEDVKKLIRDKIVSATSIRQMIKEGTLEEFLAKIGTDGIEDKGEVLDSEDVTKEMTGKKKQNKLTTKSLKLNSIKEFKKFAKQFTQIFPNTTTQAVFEVVTDLIENKMTYEQILNYFTDEKTKSTAIKQETKIAKKAATNGKKAAVKKASRKKK